MIQQNNNNNICYQLSRGELTKNYFKELYLPSNNCLNSYRVIKKNNNYYFKIVHYRKRSLKNVSIFFGLWYDEKQKSTKKKKNIFFFFLRLTKNKIK
jgi:hypothetical protein